MVLGWDYNTYILEETQGAKVTSVSTPFGDNWWGLNSWVCYVQKPFSVLTTKQVSWEKSFKLQKDIYREREREQILAAQRSILTINRPAGKYTSQTLFANF